MMFSPQSRHHAVFSILILTLCCEVRAQSPTNQCSINVLKDLGNDGPLPISMTENRIIHADSTGNVRLNAGQSIDLYCNNQFQGDTDYVRTAICVQYDQFTMDGNPLQISSLQCNQYRSTNSLITELPNNIQRVQIGFQVYQQYITVIDVYMSAGDKRPLFAHHRVGPGIQNGYRFLQNYRPNFRLDGIYTSAESSLYSTQNTNICKGILNIPETSSTCVQYFADQNEKKLVKGHLAPLVDFEYRATQIATFSLANSVPQWQSINNGHWKKLESSIRMLAIASGELDVITGTLDTMQMNNINGVPTRVSLDSSGLLPVPKVIYKIIVDRSAMRAVVMVANNDPLVSQSAILANQLCADKKSLIQWIDLEFPQMMTRGKKRVRTVLDFEQMARKGYVYACDLTEFLGNTGIIGLPDFIRPNLYSLLIKAPN